MMTCVKDLSGMHEATTDKRDDNVLGVLVIYFIWSKVIHHKLVQKI